jgi:hypothetical protein
MSQSIGEVASVSEYMSLVEDIWVRWSEDCDFVSDIWFRGQGDASWDLTPSALRPPFSSVNEHRYRHDFKLRAQPFLHEATQPPRDEWDWYFLMQHFGVPTRLLDWTESALVALYFAAESRPDSSGAVWILDPRQINKSLAKIGAFIPIYSAERVTGYLPELWDEADAHLAKGVIAIDPPLNSPRLAAQRGKFTVSGRGARSLQAYKSLSKKLVSIDVPSIAKGRIIRQLMSAGISHSILFPGLHGLGKELRDLYAYEHTM